MSLFRIENLVKTYDERVVLNLPELEIEEKRIVALLGPNGAGKTTLMKILAFLEFPTSGDIWYQQRPVQFAKSELHSLRRKVVMVNQYPILFSTTVFKNLEFGLKIRKIPPKKRKYLIDEALDLVGMRDFALAPAKGLSGGETQRVALARALVLSPKIFLCDEPTSSVDLENQAIIVNLLQELNETKQMSILFTTHDRVLSTSMAHQTLTLNHGKLVLTVFDNVFSATPQYSENGNFRFALSPDISIVSSTPMKGRSKDKIRVFINPAEIKLYLNDENHPKENVFQGTVSKLLKEESTIKLRLDAGVSYTSVIDEEEYRRKPFIIGETITFYIPPEAVRPIF